MSDEPKDQGQDTDGEMWCYEYDFEITPPSNELRLRYPNLENGLWAIGGVMTEETYNADTVANGNINLNANIPFEDDESEDDE